ncbi:hypothetical protein N7499_001297 [Penicillium canescens]|uniref:Uncharacterized protein n=1 Tax=Penicillium canescens TaxID=5083 RepID=A0AAD6N3X4_PENCN|nr:uncharacterized protein N7446_003562 [Penicillium canescens]KAJ6008652.1 hypothetical protein N7522_003668 [Penicillium canescens]KAJ6027839.1 hypothetical protein N7460_012656 [Penicillium canescens]KAJ6041121.1 hypothetical protein N7444_010026 [Penicillium canescens]KAJ6066525.1 hypothetical protein N7446_003562 [Penicillium canescens]KAJ6101667.1 hypothetical protein N7499_001297 [Penicillium canescens]
MLLVHAVALLATAASAAPFAERSLNSTKWTPEHVLQPGEIILFGEGRMEVVHESVYQELISSQALSHHPGDFHAVETPSASRNSSKLHYRDSCDLTTAVITDNTQTFVDWDVQMSPVVIGTGNGMDVSVSSGYTVGNSISVSAGLDLSLIKDKLGSSVGIDYTRTWTTQTVVTVKGTVANGYSGVMITKPIKTRKSGRVLKGCLGSQTEEGTFSADSYEDGSYSGVKWVSGAITMCSKKEFPLSRCSGSGNFV